ncbi:MAG: hypothetical protein AB7E55_10870 [Pigmentiphaga sp.]
MARLARLFCPDTPHLLQIAVLPTATAVNVPVLDGWARWVAQEAQARQVALHGWALVPREILLLLTPSSADSLRSLVQRLGRRIAAQRGGGQVFEGRYHSAVVQPGKWVLPALIWLENLPTRYDLAPGGEYWRWSSARAHAGLESADALSMHADYWRYGNTPFDRQATYRGLLRDGLDRQTATALQSALTGQWALGDPDFVARAERLGGRRAAPRPRGRPRKPPATTV